MTRRALSEAMKFTVCDALVALDGKQQLPQKHGAAGPGSGDSQILRRMVGQEDSGQAIRRLPRFWSIGIDELEVKMMTRS